MTFKKVFAKFGRGAKAFFNFLTFFIVSHAKYEFWSNFAFFSL